MYSLSSTEKTRNISCLQNPHASHPCHSTAAGCELFKKRMLSDYLCPGKMRQTLTRFCSRGLRGKNDDACDDISYNSAADAVSPTKSPAM